MKMAPRPRVGGASQRCAPRRWSASKPDLNANWRRLDIAKPRDETWRQPERSCRGRRISAYRQNLQDSVSASRRGETIGLRGGFGRGNRADVAGPEAFQQTAGVGGAF